MHSTRAEVEANAAFRAAACPRHNVGCAGIHRLQRCCCRCADVAADLRGHGERIATTACFTTVVPSGAIVAGDVTCDSVPARVAVHIAAEVAAIIVAADAAAPAAAGVQGGAAVAVAGNAATAAGAGAAAACAAAVAAAAVAT